MRTLPPSAELAAVHAAWRKPFLADPRDETANAFRTAQTREVARLLLAAPLRTRTCGMTLDTGGWSRERAALADAAGPAGSPEWMAALGDHEHVTLTADGGAANRGRWCECAPFPAGETWVRYEHWTAAGMERHGYVCPSCRRLAQTG